MLLISARKKNVLLFCATILKSNKKPCDYKSALFHKLLNSYIEFMKKKNKNARDKKHTEASEYFKTTSIL